MDFVKEKSNSYFKPKFLFFCVFIVILIWVFWPKNDIPVLDRSQILTAKVKYADLDIKVDGYGKLFSNRKKILTSQTNATVEKILLKPGNQVSERSIIAVLSNPEIDNKLNTAKQELYKEKANLRKLKLSQERELLSEKTRVDELRYEVNIANLSNQAYQELAKDRVISELTSKTNLLKEAQLKEKLRNQEQGIHRLKSIHDEMLSIQEEVIKQRQGQLELIKNIKDRLTVRAGIEGVLQNLDVELGQSLTPGQKIALVDGMGEMVVIAKLPQSNAEKVKVGQKVIVDTRRDEIAGSILRIEPAVLDGNITVEVAIEEELKHGVHPGMAVDIEVQVETLENVRYVKRPAGVRSFQNVKVLVLDNANNSARYEDVLFGEENDTFIQVISGLETHDEIVISDMNKFSNAKQFILQ